MRSLALDLTRLGLGPARLAPRGIDRVELAYARYFLTQWPGECVAILPTILGARLFGREQTLRGLAALEKLWQENIQPSEDQAYLRTKSFLAGQTATASPTGQILKPRVSDQARGFIQIVSAAGFSFGHSLARELPKDAIYLNVGQLGVFRPLLSWLHRRPDVRAFFMLHDLIPLEYPKHHRPIGIRLHRSIVKNTAEFAHAIIVASDAVRTTVHDAMSWLGRGDLPIHVELLPVPSEFLVPAAKDAELARVPYFIVCGTIDSYKNHLLLLEVWRELVARQGARVPKLIIAGSPGVTSRTVLDVLKTSTAIHRHVILISGLSTPALRNLIAGARALLMPSLAEGFGLPIVEALAQGTPVIASDIPAHREAGRGGGVTYLSPSDAGLWSSCIGRLSSAAPADITRARGYQPKTWQDYFAGIESFIARQVAAIGSRNTSGCRG